MPLGSLGELVVQASSGVRLSNMFNAPNFEEVKGYMGLGLSMMCQPILCFDYVCTRSRDVRDRTLEFHMWINYANKRTLFPFSLHLESQSYIPLFKAMFQFSHCKPMKADSG